MLYGYGTMINAITISRTGKTGYSMLLDVLEALAADPAREFASPTHAAVTLIRRSKEYREMARQMATAKAAVGQ